MQNDGMACLMERTEFRDKLFARGFFLTNSVVDDQAYPFYGLWNKIEIPNGGGLLVHPKQRAYCFKNLVLVGHAYDPFRMESREDAILQTLYDGLAVGKARFYELFHQITGVFTLIITDGTGISLFGDATGIQTTFYALSSGKYYVSSHTCLIGDLLQLQRDPYVEELSQYRFFPLLGNYLPGDLTQYREVKRLVPNHCVRITEHSMDCERFYIPRRLPITKIEVQNRAAQLLHNNLELITQKWKSPAISMTGGCDSKTTLACAKGLYDKFSYFSYVSSEAERVDAEAAHRICESLELPHTIYNIPASDGPNYAAVSAILRYNKGDICNCNPNDVRKRDYFADTKDFDVEVKSWASEVGRAYYSKRFHGRLDFGAGPTPRACTTLYKFFLHNRKLVHKTDAIFAEYIKNFLQDQQGSEYALPWQEQFFWEFRMASWNGLVITGEHRYSFDITIPYNNRRLLELLLSVPIEDRLADTLYQEIRQQWNPAIDATGISVTNLKHTQRRGQMENLYFLLHSRLPF